MMNNTTALKKNLLSNGALFILNGIIGFWLPPYLIKKLGVGAYGMIPLATTIIGYASVITVGINGALSRFMALSKEQEGDEGSSQVFNTAFIAISGLLLLLIPFFIIVSTHIDKLVSVPAAYAKDTVRLFLCVSCSFILTCVTSAFNVSAYVANRLDLVNQVTVINTLIRVVIIVSVFLFIDVSLFGYGIAVVLGSIAASRYSFYLFRRYSPNIKFRIKDFKTARLSALLSMGGWLVIIQLGSILFLQIDLLVVNKILGNEAAGQYSVILQWSNLIRTLSISLSGVLGPLILTLYARGEILQMTKLTLLSNKALTLFVTCIVAPLCILSGDLLTVWVGEEFARMKWLFLLVLLPLPINLGIQPLFSLNRAYNKVKVPGIFTVLMGMLNLLLAITLVKYTTLGLYGVAVASGFVLTVKNFVFMPIYIARHMGISKWTFFRSSRSAVILLSIAVAIGYFYPKILHIHSWPGILLHAAILFGFFSMLSYAFLSKEERRLVVNKFIKKK
ncbi:MULTISPECIES: oligosaccharide flippase family protein [Olivibacter]|jgi:membrane protein EpsK|uniref:Oligosaccharide flippase family protein n=1 Tax=Olivibacter oleidegradans TaxID=760123 RepID=A0ABV6HG42_9SPHI|nr:MULTISPECIES: oligosaccharide flippase family protein [Olivibacter]QEL00336.1 oligosaccharide flippase family protein [Olivibacter sp. LS-1]